MGIPYRNFVWEKNHQKMTKLFIYFFFFFQFKPEKSHTQNSHKEHPILLVLVFNYNKVIYKSSHLIR